MRHRNRNPIGGGGLPDYMITMTFFKSRLFSKNRIVPYSPDSGDSIPVSFVCVRLKGKNLITHPSGWAESSRSKDNKLHNFSESHPFYVNRTVLHSPIS